jgi:hypothetical protein
MIPELKNKDFNRVLTGRVTGCEPHYLLFVFAIETDGVLLLREANSGWKLNRSW